MPAPTTDRWDIYDDALPFAGAKYGPQRARMAAIGIGDGALLIVSPGVPMSDAGWNELARLGTPRFLLAPNHFHNLGLAAWQARFPAATIVAHPRAQPRLRKKLPGLVVADLAPLIAALPAGVRVFSPPMARQGETFVSIATQHGVAWFVTDALVNEERLPGAMGLFMRLMGFRTGLMTNPFFKRLFLSNKAAYKEWMHAELERDRPTLFVPAHGAVLRGPDLVDRLRAATDAA